MLGFVAGLVILGAFLGAAWWFANLNPDKAARNTRLLLGGGALVAGIVLTLRGAPALGAPIGMVGLGMLGVSIGQNRRGSQGEPPARTQQSMSLDEARDILGVHLQADAAEIREAHRRLMKKLHPDTGEGSPGLARRLNEARDLLLSHLDS